LAKNIALKKAAGTQFKGKNGRIRTFSGSTNKKGQLLDTDGNIISKKYFDLDFSKNLTAETPSGSSVPDGGKEGLKLMDGAGKALGKVVLKAGAAAAAVAIVATTITLATKQFNKHAEAAKNASEAAKDAAMAYEKVS
jgi:hypothetical protein